MQPGSTYMPDRFIYFWPNSVINSLSPGKYGNSFKRLSFKLNLLIDILPTFGEIGLRWVPQNSTDDRWTFVQV